VELLFSRFAEFKKRPRHPKWQEVDLSKELPGWQRFPAAQELLEQTKFDEFRARFKGGSVAARSAAEKQQLFGSSASGRKVRASGHEPLVGAAT
jgi:CO/xanthine dehydrogenase Mo-binding subunit